MYEEKVSNYYKMKIAGIDPAEIIVPFTAEEIQRFGKTMNPGKGFVLIFLRAINSN